MRATSSHPWVKQENAMDLANIRSRRDARRLVLSMLACAAITGAMSGPAATAAPAPEPAAAPSLKIGIIGTGKIGGGLARHWAKAGHELMLSSRHPEQLQALAAELGAKVRVGTPQQAAAFGNVILVSVPYGAMPQIGKDYAKELAGKIIIDTSNPQERRDGPMAAEAQRKGAGVATAEYLNNKRVVRAFNCISAAQVVSDSNRKPVRRAIPIGGNDVDALAIAGRLVSDAGFDPALIGSLVRSREFDLGQPLANHDWTVAEFVSHLSQ
jgi:predicted dinucleotide-binding enzyme